MGGPSVSLADYSLSNAACPESVPANLVKSAILVRFVPIERAEDLV
jgi:hypothetical protein